jgi:hypothetical protein
MAELSAFMPQPLAVAIRDAVDTYARMAKADGDESAIGQLRVGVLADLALRPWDTSRPAVTAHLRVLAPLDTLVRGAIRRASCSPAEPSPRELSPADRDRCEPAELDGQPITAAHLRALLEQFDALCPGGLQAPAGGSVTIAVTDPRSGALRASLTRTELERAVRRGCPEHPGDRCRCPVLDRPPPVDRYRPTPAQDRFVRTRDRTCRHPGCRNDAAWADLDHVVPHAAGGDTFCENLCCLCRRHHRLKTHARGWRFVMAADGVLTVTTPSGVTRVTRPPGLRDTADAPLPAFSDPEPAPFSYEEPPF